MDRKKKMRKQQIKNYFKFVAAGILILVLVAFVSGCGNRPQEDSSSSDRKKVLSQAEIEELTDLVVKDIEDDSLYDDEEDEDERDVEGIITDHSDANSHYTYVWGWKDHGEDDEDDEDPKILAQVSEDGKVLQTFSEEDIELYPGKRARAITEFQGVTDQELVFCANLYMDDDTYIWYRIPLSYEKGAEKVLYDKKEVIYEEKDERSHLSCGVGKYLFCEDEKGCFILDQESGEKQRVVKDSKEKSYGYTGETPWVSPEGDIYVLLEGYRDHLVDSFYAYQVGTENIQKITDGISTESRTAYGDGKLFFTRLVDGEKHDDYNIYVYDMISGQKKVLVSEAEVRNVLPEKPSDHADFIREMAYAGGTLYLEIRYAEQCCVVSCAVDQGTLTVLDGLSELVRHREYQLSEPIENGNGKYYNVNDHNIFEQSEDGVVERTLDGAYVRTIRLPYSFVYANNRELIYSFEPGACVGDILYSVPLTSLDGNDYPDINRKEILLDNVNPPYDGDGVLGRNLYADEQYLVYITSDHDFIVYDRQAQTFLDIAGLPQERHGFLSGDALSNMSGEYVFFNSKSENGKADKFGFSLYHFGDSKVTRIDPRCYTSAPAYWCGDGKTIVYESHSDDGNERLEICSYDIDTGDRTVLFTEEDLLAAFKQVFQNRDIETYFERFFASDKIYYIASALQGNECQVLSYDPAGEGKLEYETQISAFINADMDLALWAVDVAEGKLFIRKCQIDEDDEDEKVIKEKYSYYDLSTGKHAEFGRNDREGLYLSLVDF